MAGLVEKLQKMEIRRMMNTRSITRKSRGDRGASISERFLCGTWRLCRPRTDAGKLRNTGKLPRTGRGLSFPRAGTPCGVGSRCIRQQGRQYPRDDTQLQVVLFRPERFGEETRNIKPMNF